METKALHEKWVIIPFGIKSREVQQLDFRIPSGIIHCTGVAVSVTGLMGFYYPHNLGELSLSINNRKSQPVCLPVKCTPDHFRLDYILCKLEQPIVGGSRVNGYYKNTVPIDYSVKIYLQCLHNL